MTAFVVVLYCYSGDYVQQGLLSKHFLWTFYKYKAAFIDSFCNSIVLLLWRLCTTWASFKTLVSKEAVTWQLENLRVPINFYKKQHLPFITHKKKHLSKQVVPITYTMEEKTFAAATFEDF